MLTKTKIQYIKSLHDKQGRRESGCFLVEGRKGIEEFVASDFEIVEGFFLEEGDYDFPHETISAKELEKISTLTSNNFGLIVVKMRENIEKQKQNPPNPLSQGGIQKEKTEELKITLILDGINDPGNLGTIIRTADWYGITHIIASLDTVDCYSSKVIMATMGSFTRIRISYLDLEKYLNSLSGSAIYGAYLDGESVHEKNFSHTPAYLVIGSESHGIRPPLEKYITDKITIPRYGEAESLNAGVATAIILDNMRRNMRK